MIDVYHNHASLEKYITGAGDVVRHVKVHAVMSEGLGWFPRIHVTGTSDELVSDLSERPLRYTVACIRLPHPPTK